MFIASGYLFGYFLFLALDLTVWRIPVLITNKFNCFSPAWYMTSIAKKTNDMIIFQRIDVENFKQSFYNLHSINDKLNTFMQLITDDFQTAFQRMYFALYDLMEFVVLEDFQLMQQMLHDYLNVYALRYGMVVDRTQRAMGEMMGMLPATVNESHPLQRYIPGRSVKALSAVLMASFHTQWLLDATSVNPLIENIPSRLVSDRLRLRECQTFKINITNLLQNPLRQPDISELHILIKEYTSNRCVSELASKLESLVHGIN